LDDRQKQLRHVWVIGGGRLGRKAIRRFLQRGNKVDITVVEQDQEQCSCLKLLPVTCFQQDGVRFLIEQLGRGFFPDWIIPMVPFHLAFEWMKQMLSSELELVPLTASENILKQFPNTVKGDKGRFFTSLADFLCPEDCPALDHVCTIRKKARPYLLYQKIETQKIDGFSTIVVQSQQILPGIGGYRPEDLYQALNLVKTSKGPILLSTACKCHGVVDLFKTYPYYKNNRVLI
jgi:hypothetical protein